MDCRSEDDITFLARANHRNVGRLFGIRRRDRRSHMFIIGKTGTGKSTLLKNMVLQDIANGEGLALLDPHGDLVEEVAHLVPAGRRDDVIYLNTPSATEPWQFNPLSGVPAGRRALVAAGIVEVFRKLWPDEWGPRLEHLLRNVVFTLLELPGATLGHVPRLLTDFKYRRELLRRVSDKTVRDFWFGEYDRYSPGFRSVVIAPLQNKLGALLTDPRLRAILTARKSSFDLQQAMDSGNVLLVNLAKGRIGEGPAALLGSLLVSHMGLAGLARAEQGEPDRRDFYLHLDEFQIFATQSLANMLAELRKYRVAVTLGCQHLSQVNPTIVDAILGNAGTLISFRVGARDADLLAREFEPTFQRADFLSLPNFGLYLRLMVDLQPSRPFSAQTLHRFAAHSLPAPSGGA